MVGEQDTRDSSPPVTASPLHRSTPSSTFSISPSFPRQPLVLDSFVTSQEFTNAKPLH